MKAKDADDVFFTFMQCESSPGEVGTWSVRLFVCLTPAVPHLRCLGRAGALQECAGCASLPNDGVNLWGLKKWPGNLQHSWALAFQV